MSASSQHPVGEERDSPSVAPPSRGTFHEGSHLFNKYLLSVFAKHTTQLIRHWEYVRNKRDPHLAHWFEEEFGKNDFESEEGYVDSVEEKTRVLGWVLLKTNPQMIDPKRPKGAADGVWGDRREAGTHVEHTDDGVVE